MVVQDMVVAVSAEVFDVPPLSFAAKDSSRADTSHHGKKNLINLIQPIPNVVGFWSDEIVKAILVSVPAGVFTVTRLPLFLGTVMHRNNASRKQNGLEKQSQFIANNTHRFTYFDYGGRQLQRWQEWQCHEERWNSWFQLSVLKLCEEGNTVVRAGSDFFKIEKIKIKGSHTSFFRISPSTCSKRAR